LQQMKLIDNAIDQYASFWPRWVYPGNNIVADRGWPDFIPGRLFAVSANGGPFNLAPDNQTFNDHLTFDMNALHNVNPNGNPNPVSGIWYESDPPAGTGDMHFQDGDVDFASECLTYALTAQSGK